VKTFSSKIDAVLIAPFIVIEIALLGAIFFSPLTHANTVIYAGLAAFLAALFVLLIYPCTYELGDQKLKIRCGVFSRRIAYREITRIEKTRNPRSGPALSLQRIEIFYAQRSILISPSERDVFIQLLNDRIKYAHAATRANSSSGSGAR
jgi:membrane protein YdbS with pleckstrin-like domain